MDDHSTDFSRRRRLDRGRRSSETPCNASSRPVGCPPVRLRPRRKSIPGAPAKAGRAPLTGAGNVAKHDTVSQFSDTFSVPVGFQYPIARGAAAAGSAIPAVGRRATAFYFARKHRHPGVRRIKAGGGGAGSAIYGKKPATVTA